MSTRIPVFAISLFLFIVSASADDSGLPISEPEKQGIDSRELIEVSQWIRQQKLDVRSLLVLRNGSLVMEWYAGDVSRDHNHNIFSVTKSVVSTLAGIAIGERDIKSVDTTLSDLLREAKGTPGANISLNGLLTMRSGYPVSRGNRKTGPERQLFDRLHESPDRTKSILELDLSFPTGKTFRYNNIDPHLVLASVESATRKDIHTFARETLFEPLGFENDEWVFADRKGQVPGGYGLRLRAIDLAKLGQLFLDGGTWKERRILSEEFTTTSTSDQYGTGYGYFWWVPTPKRFAARGVRGQLIEIDRAKNTVIVLTSDLEPTKVLAITKKITTDIRAAAKPAPLPANPDATRALQQELKTAAEYIPANRTSGLPNARLPRR